jgi:ATP-binding cassette subfamily F protein uup
LDEPTNDLDIPTLEVLEESLLEFKGALVLVTHDRYMLDRVSTLVLGLDGKGGSERFADYSQWDAWQTDRKPAKPTPANAAAPESAARPTPIQKKLSYLDSREHAGIEQRIVQAEQAVERKRAALHDPAVLTDGRLVQQAYREMEEAEKAVTDLYARWAELEDKIG